MKIADVTVGTEYAYSPYGWRDTDYVRLAAQPSRVLVTAIHPGGKVSIEFWDKEAKAFPRRGHRPVSAQALICPWVDAVSILREIRERRIADAKARQERLAREQAALRAVGKFLENNDAADMNGLPYSLGSAIALANGDEGLKDFGNMGTRPTHHHNPKVEVNVTTLLALLRMAYADGVRTGVVGPVAAWSQPSAD